MKNIYDVRCSNSRLLVEHAGSMSAFAQQIERSQTQVSRSIGIHPVRNIGEKLARHIEHSFCLPQFWLDTDHTHQEMPVKGYVNHLNQEKYLELHQILSDILLAVKEHRIDEVTYTQLLEMARQANKTTKKNAEPCVASNTISFTPAKD